MPEHATDSSDAPAETVTAIGTPAGAEPAAGRLTVSAELSLPLDTVTETLAILAKRGSGKTYTAAVLVEEMIGAGLPVIVVDPVGVWWGLRSSADGGADGLPVVIFGGEHADLPLSERTGARIAEVLVARRTPAVLDLSELSKSAARRFMTEFLEHLYRVNRDPLHLVLDEADLFAPQRTDAGGARLLGAVQDVQRRGRARGLGTTLITQRPAVLHKDVLSQAEVLIALRMTGPRDVAAIDEWVRLHADDDAAAAVKASLAALPVGTAWVWSPGWLEILQQVRIRTRRTFDSSATPKPGRDRVVADRMAEVDLAALRELLTHPDHHPDPDDTPSNNGAGAAAGQRETELLARIADLEQAGQRARDQLAARPREVPVLTDADRAAVTSLIGHIQQLTTLGEHLERALHAAAPGAGPGPAAPPAATPPTSGQPARSGPRPAPPGRPGPPPPAPERAVVPDQADAALAESGGRPRSGAARMLQILAGQHPRALTRAQLATLAGIAVKGGTYSTYLSTLRTRGYITETGGLISLTTAGRDTAGPAIPLTTEQIRDQWRSQLRLGARVMLDTLIAHHPTPVSRAELAAAADLTETGGTFSTYLSTLRRNGLAHTRGDLVHATDVLFPSPTGPDHHDPTSR